MSQPQPLSQRPLVSRLRAGQWFAVSGAALAVLFAACLALGIVAIVKLDEARTRVVDRIDPAQFAAQRMHAALLNQETGVRGYALTGDRSFLAPYDRGVRQERAARRRLQQLARELDLEAVTEGVRRVERLARAWKRDYVTPALAVAGEGRRAALDEAATEIGRARFDAVRAGFGALDAAIAAARAEARRDLHDAAGFLIAAFVAIAVLLVAAAVVGAILLTRTVSRPLRRLSLEMRKTADGDLGHAIHGEGARDIVDLGEDIGRLRRRVVAELEALRRANEQLDAQALELRRSNAELEQFAYVASHDLQEPLRKVASFTQLLQRRYGGQLDERADQYIAFAGDGARRMQRLINDLLAFSRVGRLRGEASVVDANELVDAALDNLAEAVRESGATVEVGDLPAVRGEPALLTAVFQNLIGNAIKFRRDEPPVVRVSAEPDGTMWAFTVSDNGIGIDPEYAERIFVIFQRLHPKEAYEGTGIGLALCRKIVEHHGGTIRLDPPGDGPGATFRFTLPKLEEPA
ncbi:MAG: CHASE3 domain-containing protein [Solirubrobacteraceae bacterium]|nr:CHASE3 domain-containing protein [Solirubrobacteraceae bacterium]